MRHLGELVTRAARFAPDEVGFVDGDRSVTNRDHAARCQALASALRKAGCGKQDRVSVLSMNRLEYAEIFGATWLSGLILATVNFRLAAPEIGWILQDSRPRVLILESQYVAIIDSLRGELGVEIYVCIDDAPEWAVSYEDFLASGLGGPAGEEPGPEDISHLIYTSGTTGRPKGVLRSHRAELAVAQSMSLVMDMRPTGRVLEVMPMFHAGAQSSIVGQLYRGGQVHIHRGFDPGDVLKAIERERITHLHLVPLMVQALVEHPDLAGTDVSSVETILYAAAPMPVPVLRRALAAFGPVFVNSWGQTEGTGTSLPKHLHSVDGEAASLLGSIGNPYPVAEVRIVDDQGEDCAIGSVGEVWIRSEANMTGYWNNPQATAEAFADGWLKTGDMGRMDDCQRVFLVDRKKDMIISGGENIYSQEVERAVAEHPAVSQVAVIGEPDEKWGERVVAAVVLRPGAEATQDEIIAHAASLIASYKKPKRVVFLDEMPALPSGKIDKKALRVAHAGVSHG